MLHIRSTKRRKSSHYASLVTWLLFVLASNDVALASLAELAGYQPLTQVTDNAAIDMDLAIVQRLLQGGSQEDIDNAQVLYEQGGNSGSYAQLTLESPLQQDIPEGSVVTGISQNGAVVKGFVLEDAMPGDFVLRVRYEIFDDPAAHVLCRVGGLALSGASVEDGCFQNNSTNVTVELEAGAATVTLPYSDVQNLNRRKLKQLSLQSGAASELDVFPKFVSYYNDTEDYADRIITGAIEGTGDIFSNFTLPSRISFVGIGILSLEVWMAVVAEMGNAIELCQSKNPAPAPLETVAPWDRAVAYYVGSSKGGDTQGLTIHAVADIFCRGFNTCDEQSAAANVKVMREFNAGQQNLLDGDCNSAQQSKDAIVRKMQIPLIQGVLQSGYILPLSPGQQAQAASISFAVGILPLVAACNRTDAKRIEEVIFDGVSLDYGAFRVLLENNYDCLGVSCADIGGFINPQMDMYLTGAEPCEDPVEPSLLPSVIPSVFPSASPSEMAPMQPTMGSPVTPVSVASPSSTSSAIPNSIPTLPPTEEPPTSDASTPTFSILLSSLLPMFTTLTAIIRFF